MLPLLSLITIVAAKTWTADDLVPVLTAAVEAQLDKLTQGLHLQSPPQFRQVGAINPRQMLRDEIKGFVEDMWPVLGQPANVLAPPAFRQLQTSEVLKVDPLEPNPPNYTTFELDAKDIQGIFNASLEAAVKPLHTLFKLQEDKKASPQKVTMSWLKEARTSSIQELSVPTHGLEPKTEFPLSLGIGDMTVVIPVHKLIKNRQRIEQFIENTQRHLNETSFVWPAISRLADVHSDVLPIFNDMMPHLQRLSYRTLAALLELSPRRLNSVTVVPALLEIMTVSTLAQAGMETTLPLAGIVLAETDQALGVILKYLPFLRKYITEIQEVLPVVGDLDSHYKPLASAMHRNLQAVNDFLPDIENFIPTFQRLSPGLRKFLRILSGMGGDVSTSLDTTLDRMAREAPRIMEFYDRTEEFVPLLISNLISTLRRTGLPARFPSIRENVPELAEAVPALRGFLADASKHLPEISETLVPVAASIPRHAGVAATTSDLLIHTSMAMNTLNATVLPSLGSMLEVIDPFAETLNAPVLNVVVFLPLLMAVTSSAVATLPRLTAAMPAFAPVMRGLSRLATYIRPVVPAAREFATAASSIRESEQLVDASYNLLAQLPSLFDKPILF